MNREIEFRAWLKDEKRMVAVVDLKFLTDHYGNKKEIVYWDENINSANYAYFEEIELMQYTGLKDKNGVKIFEGDIVKMQTRGFDNKIITCSGIVKYFKEETCFVIELKKININIYEDTQYLYEVIGNIYENKELLEDE